MKMDLKQRCGHRTGQCSEASEGMECVLGVSSVALLETMLSRRERKDYKFMYHDVERINSDKESMH